MNIEYAENVIHNQPGDMIPGPDMMIAVYAGRNVAEALTYPDTGIFTEVYAKDCSLADDAERHSLNDLLHTWLSNLVDQVQRRWLAQWVWANQRR